MLWNVCHFDTEQLLDAGQLLPLKKSVYKKVYIYT